VFSSGVTRGGGRPGHWPKLKKSHTKGRKNTFLKGHHFYGGEKILIWLRATNTLVTSLVFSYSFKLIH